MQEHGRIICVMQKRQGVSQRSGEMWESQSYVLEIDGRYTRRVLFDIFGSSAIARANLQVGDFVTMMGEVEAHEYQGRWYNEVRCYDIIKNGQSAMRNVPSTQSAQYNAPQPTQQAQPIAPGSYQQAPQFAPQTAQPTPQNYAPAPQFAPGTPYQAQAFPGTNYPTPEVPPTPTQASY